MFGFYALWGQFFIAYLLQPYLSPEIFMRVSDIAILLGSPFIVFAWLMLIKFAYEFKRQEISNLFIGIFLFLNVTIIILLVFYLKKNPGIGLLTILK
jgi:hypothetical protein